MNIKEFSEFFRITNHSHDEPGVHNFQISFELRNVNRASVGISIRETIAHKLGIPKEQVTIGHSTSTLHDTKIEVVVHTHRKYINGRFTYLKDEKSDPYIHTFVCPGCDEETPEENEDVIEGEQGVEYCSLACLNENWT